MSCAYGFYCVDCKDTYIDDSNGDMKPSDDLAEIIAIAPKLATLRSEFPCLEIGITQGFSHRLQLSWFEAHGTHKLEIIDEYGALYPGCEKHHFYCKLKDGHDGECSGSVASFEPLDSSKTMRTVPLPPAPSGPAWLRDRGKK